jgi:hypothetical protein
MLYHEKNWSGFDIFAALKPTRQLQIEVAEGKVDLIKMEYLYRFFMHLS